MGYTNEETAKMLGFAVLAEIDRNGMQLVWKPMQSAPLEAHPVK